MTAVGIILGSTRPGRVSAQVAEWVRRRAALHPALLVEVLDLAEIGLPFLDEAEHASSGRYAHRHTREWSRRIDALDAVVLVTPEYNSSYPAPLKNALDYLYAEWRRKPVAFIGYGMTSAGTRAVSALLPVVIALGMVPAGAVQLPLRRRLHNGVLQTTPTDDAGLDALLAETLDLALALRPERVAARSRAV